MKVLIHRGTHQIGGCCTEIATETTRILIDFGMSLPGGEPTNLDVSGVTDTTDSCDAIIISHYHGDHLGELSNVNQNVPIYMGELARELEIAYQNHMGSRYMGGMDFHITIPFSERPFQIGDIIITPIASDHSAFGSYMFMMEADGKRILHTGDFRLHGPRKEALTNSLEKLPHIDLLITEGTTLGSDGHPGYDEEKRVNHFFRGIDIATI